MTTTRHRLDDEAAQLRWRALWDESPQRSAFSSLPFVQATADVLGLQGEMLLVKADGADAAGAVVLAKQRGPYRITALPPFVQYSPLLLAAPLAEADVHARRDALGILLEALAERDHVLRFFVSALPDVRPARWRRWKATPFYTYRLPLDGLNDIAADWSGGTRRLVRKQAAAYRVAEDGAVHAVVRLCESSYQRHGAALPLDATRLQRLAAAMHAEGMVRVFTATPTSGGAPVAGIAVLHDGRSANYWIAGSERGPAMTVLLADVLERLRAEGFALFDFVGANTPSIAEFKRHFGPTLTPYFLLENVTRPELRLYFAFRDLRR